MKKLLAYSAISFLGFLPIKAAFADILNVTFDGTNYTVQRYNTSTGSATDLTSFTSPYGTCAGCTFVDEYEGKLYLGGGSGWAIYDIESNSVELVDKPSGSLIQTVMPWAGNTAIKKNNDGTIQIGGDTDDIDVVSDGLNIDGAAVITKNSDGSVQIGGDTDDIDVVSDGLNIDGAAVITKNSDGSVQIGGDTDDIDIVSDGLNIDGAAVITKNSDGSVQIGGDTDDIDIVSDGLNIDGAAVITKNSDGSIQIGADGNDIDITAEGLTVDGVSLITKKESGEIHIGKNSLITKEEDGVQKLYAKDENGNAIDINVTNGSKLLIDGVEVKAGNNAQITTNKNNITTNKNNISTNKTNIKKLGEGVAGSTALTAALTALPQTSKESKLSCGVGTGAYSSRYALGFGCASKINERVDINAGGSYVFGGSKSYGEGTLDSGVIKAGFVFKLGELNKPTLISMHEKEKMEDKIFSLEEKNEKIISQNEDLKNKNQSIIAQNKSLLARLERLEKLALIETKSKDLATIKLP